MSVASTVERQMLDLINFERTSRGLDSLALELRLNNASEDHSEWMDDTRIFSHTGVGGSSPGDRIVDAGFTLSGNWTWGENIAYQSERGAPGIADDVVDLHTSLMNSPGHRANILNPDFEEIGIGIELGDFTYDSGSRLESIMVTQNFGHTDAEPTAPVTAPESLVSNTTENAALAASLEDVESGVVETTTVTSGSTISSGATVTATSGPDGVNVEIDGEGNFTGEGTATNGDETVTETDSGGSLVDDAPVEDMPTVDEPSVDAATVFDQFFDGFDFANRPMLDDRADEMQVVTAFEGTIATPDGTVTTNDPEDLSTFFMDLAMMANMPCADMMDMG